MQALINLVSPHPKRQKKPEKDEVEDVVIPDSDEEDMYAESARDDADSDEEQPAWARRQEERMKEHFSKLMTNSLNEVKNEVAQIKLQANLAVATAEDAMKKVSELSIKMESQEQGVTLDVLNEKIEHAMQKIKDEFVRQPNIVNATAHGSSAANKSDDVTDKLARTMVVGSFIQDSQRDEVKALIAKHIISETDETVDEIYAYSFGSIGFVRFHSVMQMVEFMKKFGNNVKPEVNGKSLWVTASKSPGERRKARHLGKHKRVLIEVGLSKAEDIRIDYRRGILMVKRIRVAEWQGDGLDGHLEMNDESLKKIGIDVGKAALQTAVEELLAE